MKKIKFHHLGLAVKEFSSAVKFYNNIGYHCTEPLMDTLQGVELVFCKSNQYPAIELVKPNKENSPIKNYLTKNNEIIYHICYEVDNISESAKVLFSNNRAICVSKPKPAILFNNRLVTFYYINNVGLIELLEK